MRVLICLLGWLAGCGGDRSCTPEGQELGGRELVVDRVEIPSQMPAPSCGFQLIGSLQDLAQAFEGTEPPPELIAIDFDVDRIVFGTYPVPDLSFAVDDGTQVVVGLFVSDPSPQLVSTCAGFVLRNTTRDSIVLHDCPSEARGE